MSEDLHKFRLEFVGNTKGEERKNTKGEESSYKMKMILKKIKLWKELNWVDEGKYLSG